MYRGGPVILSVERLRQEPDSGLFLVFHIGEHPVERRSFRVVRVSQSRMFLGCFASKEFVAACYMTERVTSLVSSTSGFGTTSTMVRDNA